MTQRLSPKVTSNNEPTHGYTADGTAVHQKTVNHMPIESVYQRFNKAAALWVTKNVGTMTCAWLFTLLCLTVVPSCLANMGVIHWNIFFATFGFNLLMTLFLSTFLELVLMPIIMVGQNLQNEAADARATKQFENTEIVKDALNPDTPGGIKEILDRLDQIERN